MQQKVKDYLEAKKAECIESDWCRREEILIDAGLYEKEYPQDEEYDDYDYPDWDEEKGSAYRKVALVVTDEEFREIAKYAVKEETVPGVGKKIMVWAIVARWVGCVVSVITGLLMTAISDELFPIGLLLIIFGILGSLIASWYVYGFGQLVDDTHAIRDKLEEN